MNRALMRKLDSDLSAWDKEQIARANEASLEEENSEGISSTFQSEGEEEERGVDQVRQTNGLRKRFTNDRRKRRRIVA